MLRARLTALIGLLLATPFSAGGDRGLFELASEKPQQAVLTAGDELRYGSVPLASVTPTSPMLLNLNGVIAVLTGPQISAFAAAAKQGGAPREVTPEFRRACVVHLINKSGEEEKRVEILIGPVGTVVGREVASPPSKTHPSMPVNPTIVSFDAEKYRQVSTAWTLYRGPFEKGLPGLGGQAPTSPPPIVSTTAELVKPLMPAPLFLDEKTFSDRFINRGPSKPAKSTRVLADEKFFLRVPAKLDPAKPIGLLVWINAGPDGQPPEVFAGALDELGIACVGIENVGNDRPVVERYQLAIDAMFAVSERLHIDPRRVYVTGISGGGRVTTRLACCLPDYFTGSAPIVGISAYFDIPVGDNKFSHAGFNKPSAPRFTLLRTRRIGMTTGDKDFNRTETVAAAKRMAADGLQVRVFDHTEFGHQMPSAEQFIEVLKWVDQPYQDLVITEAQSAQSQLDAYIQKWGDVPPPAKVTKAVADLVKVTQTGPWSPAGWHAAKLLRAAPAQP